ADCSLCSPRLALHWCAMHAVQAFGDSAGDGGNVEGLSQPDPARAFDELKRFDIHQITCNENQTLREGGAFSLEGGREFRSADLRHFDVADDEIEILLIDQIERDAAIRRALHVVAGAANHVFE